MLSTMMTYVFLKPVVTASQAIALSAAGQRNRKAGGTLTPFLILLLSCITSGFFMFELPSLEASLYTCLSEKLPHSVHPSTSACMHSCPSPWFCLFVTPLSRSLGVEIMLNSEPRRVLSCCGQFIHIPVFSLSVVQFSLGSQNMQSCLYLFTHGSRY